MATPDEIRAASATPQPTTARNVNRFGMLAEAIRLWEVTQHKPPSASDIRVLFDHITGNVGASTIQFEDKNVVPGFDFFGSVPHVVESSTADAIASEVTEILARTIGFEAYPEDAPGEHITQREFLQSYDPEELFPSHVSVTDAQRIPIYRDLYSLYVAANGGEPPVGRDIDGLVAWFWANYQDRGNAESMADIRDTIITMQKQVGKDPELTATLRTVMNAEPELAIRLLNESRERKVSIPTALELLKGEAAVKARDEEDMGEYGLQFQALYKNGEPMSEAERVQLTTLQYGHTIKREEMLPRVRGLLPLIGKNLGAFRDKDLEEEINARLLSLLQAGRIGSVTRQKFWDKTAIDNIRDSIKDQLTMHPGLQNLKLEDVVNQFTQGMITELTIVERERVKGDVAAAVNERLKLARASDLDGIFERAIGETALEFDAIVSEVIAQKRAHDEQQRRTKDELAIEGERYDMVEFDLADAAVIAVNARLEPRQNEAVVNQHKAAAAKEAMDAANVNRARTIAGANITQLEAASDGTSYSQLRELVATSEQGLGKDGQDVDLKMLDLIEVHGSAEAAIKGFVASVVPGEENSTTRSVYEAVQGVRQTQEATQADRTTLSRFGSIREALVTPEGREALQSRAPGLTGADLTEIEEIESRIEQALLEPDNALEFLGEAGEAGARAEIAAIKARPGIRFGELLDEMLNNPNANVNISGRVDDGAFFQTQARRRQQRDSFDLGGLLSTLKDDDLADAQAFLTEEGIGGLRNRFTEQFQVGQRGDGLSNDAAFQNFGRFVSANFGDAVKAFKGRKAKELRDFTGSKGTTSTLSTRQARF